jgi:hypothetical protein
VFGFPNPVNELAARTVAAGVLAMTVAVLVLGTAAGTSWLWLTAVIAAGFLARVLTGPTLSPLGQLATRVVAPRLGEPRLVAGPPKRFAQAIGLTVTAVAVLTLATGHPLATQILLGLMIVAAGLESILGYCVGCAIFAVLMRRGLVPQATCEACANIRARSEERAAPPGAR